MFPIKDEGKVSQFTPVNMSIIVINVVVFFISLTNLEYFINNYGMIPSLFFSGEKIYTIFTSMFLHGGFGHIIGNLWFLYIFGDNVEYELGKSKYIGLYLISGLFAAFLFSLLDPSSQIPLVGASGAISGVLGYYLIRFSNNRVLIWFRFFLKWISAKWYIGFWFLLQLFLSGIGGGGVAYFAHVSGFIIGALAGLWVKSFGEI